MFTTSNTVDPGEIKIPKTITPGLVWFWNFVVFGAVWRILLTILNCNFLWTNILTGLAIAIAITFGGITVEEVDYHGLLLFNPFTKKRRAIFPGLHQKLLWESVEEGSRESLRRLISSTGEENLPTNDPVENMLVHLTIHKRMNISGTPEEAADNFIRFHSIAEESLTTVVRKEVVKKFSGYYGENEMEALTDANKVQGAVFTTTDIAKKIEDMEAQWGISIGVILDTSRPDDATKAMKRTPAMAEALDTAIDKLVNGKNKMDPDKARRAALLLDPNNDYTEQKIDLEVHGLENARNITVLGLGGDKKGGKK